MWQDHADARGRGRSRYTAGDCVKLAGFLEAVSYVLPLTYAFDALDRVASGIEFGGRGWLDVAVIVSATLLALALGALTLRRRTP